MAAVGAARSGIKVGILFDLEFPPAGSWDVVSDFVDGITIAIDQALSDGTLDRPVELIQRTAEGLPRGAVKPVIDAWQELVDEGCVLVVGPMISDNMTPLREYIDAGHHVPTITWGGTDTALGDWTFAASDGNLNVEAYCVIEMVARAGHTRLAVTYEDTALGLEYLAGLRTHGKAKGVRVVTAVPVAQTEADMTDAVADLRATDPDAIAHVGFGFGLVRINAALAAAEWDPPRFTALAWENAFLNDDLFRAFAGWVGLEHYDEENPLGQQVLDVFQERFGRRPEYAYSLYGYDMGRVVVAALTNAVILSPTGVRDGLERIRMLPTAAGSAGSTFSLGPHAHRAWQTAAYLTAREVDPDSTTRTIFRGRFT